MNTYIFDARTATRHFPGIGRYVSNLVAEMPAHLLPHERLYLLTSKAGSLLDEPDQPAYRVIMTEPNVATVPTAISPFSLRQQWQIPRLLRWYGSTTPAGATSRRLYHSAYYLMPYRLGLPTIVTLHDLIPLMLPETASRRARLLFRLAARLALRAADHVIAVSESTRQDLIHRLRVDPEKVTSIPHAPTANFRPQSLGEQARIRHFYDLPPKFLLYVGINKPHKNLVRLLEAYAGLQGDAIPPLVIAGAWDERYPQAKTRVAELGLGRRVRFLGPIPERDLPGLYAACTLFVFPSLYEGFGLPVVEAMACGAAVACAETHGLRDVAGDAALRFDPHDTRQITQAMQSVLDSPEQAAAMRQKGLAHAKTFSWSFSAQRTLALYRHVLNGASPSQPPSSAGSSSPT